MSYENICNKFLNGVQELHGRSHYLQRLFISEGTLFSYGYHFPLAKKIKLLGNEEVVLINSHGYSVTTAKHKGCMESVCSERNLKVVYVFDANPLLRQEQIEANTQKIMELEKKLSKQRVQHRKEWTITEMAELVKQNSYLEDLEVKE